MSIPYAGLPGRISPTDIASTGSAATGNLVIGNVPTFLHGQNTWYVDPVLGNPANNGKTAATPWDMATALGQAWACGAATPPATQVVKPNDNFLLASGNYGDLHIQGLYSSLIGFDNGKNFLKMMAAPGAVPVFTSIKILGAGGWYFCGLTVQNLNGALPIRNYGALISIEGQAHDIIFDDCALLSAPASVTATWSQSDWLNNAPTGFGQGRCNYGDVKFLTVINCALTNMGSAIQVSGGNGVRIAGNTINYFTGDGIDWCADNLVIQNNVLTNRADCGNIATLHPDFMQGQFYGTPVVTNVLIDSNVCIRQTDPNLPFAALTQTTTNTQGISEFDGAYVNVTVSNNIVVTTCTNGMSWSNCTNLLLENNIVIPDSVNVTAYPWLAVPLGKGGTAANGVGLSSGVTLANNLAGSVVVASEIAATLTNNAALGGNFEADIVPGYWGAGVGSKYPGGNSIVGGPAAVFTKFTTVNGCVTGMDLTPLPGTTPNYNFAALPAFKI